MTTFGMASRLSSMTSRRVLVGLVAHRRDVGDDLLVDEIGDLLLQRGAIDVERNLGDDELLASPFHLLDADLAAQLHAARAGLEIILDALDAAESCRRSESPGL